MIKSYQLKNVVYFFLFCLTFNSCASTSENSSNQNEEMQEKKSDDPLLYVGTYTRKEGHVDGKAEGIYVMQMNTKTGVLTNLDTIKNTINPSYICVHPSGKYLYAVNEIADGTEAFVGTVSAFSLKKDGTLKSPLNVVNAQGDAPCHISIDRSGRYVLVASYMGTISAFPIQKDGSLGEASDMVQHMLLDAPGGRQDAAHAHMIVDVPDLNGVLVADLGMNEIIHYEFNEGKFKRVSSSKLTPGAGPRHFVLHPTKKLIYVLGELNQTIEVFEYSALNQIFRRQQVISTIIADIKVGDIGTSAIRMHPSGKFLYAANRGIQGNQEQSIAMFKVGADQGQLELLGLCNTKGLVPRDFNISPDGRFLLVGNQNSDTIETFEIDSETGILKDIGITKMVKTPVCLEFFMK